MISHAPTGYNCPFCKIAAGVEDSYTQKQDIIFEDKQTMAFVAPRWWVNNPGSVLVIPKQHFENIYDLPSETHAVAYKTAQKVAEAMKAAYGCDGVSTRQHNEPAGGQDVWHFHVQVLPRYENDNLYQNNDSNRFVSAEERLPYAEKLRTKLKKTPV
jgi:histidine triad (HIT) family protein